MRLTHLSAANIHGRFDFDVPIGPLTIIMGPNAAGKSTLLHLVLTALNPGTGRAIPVVGDTSYDWSVAAHFTDVTVERASRKGRHVVAVDGIQYGTQDGALKIAQQVGGAHSFQLGEILDLSEPKRRDAFMERALAGGTGPTLAEVLDDTKVAALAAQGVTVPPNTPALRALSLLHAGVVEKHRQANASVQSLAKAGEQDAETLRRLRRALDQHGPRLSKAAYQGEIDAIDQTLTEIGAGILAADAAVEALRVANVRLNNLNREQNEIASRAAAHTGQAGKITRALAELEASKQRLADTAGAATAATGRLEIVARSREIREKRLALAREQAKAVEARVSAAQGGRAIVEGLLGVVEALSRVAGLEPREKEIVDDARTWLQATSPAEISTTAETAATAASLVETVRRLERQARAEAEAAGEAQREAHADHNRRHLALVDAVAIRDQMMARIRQDQAREPDLLAEIDEVREAICSAHGASDSALRERHGALQERRAAVQRKERAAADVDAMEATLAERREAYSVAVALRATLHELRGAVDAAREKALDLALSGLVAPMERMVGHVLPGHTVALEGGARVVLAKPGGDRVPLGSCSTSEQAIVQVALRVAVASTMTGWRHVILDDLEHVQAADGRRDLLVEALALALDEGLVDTVLLACVADGWLPQPPAPAVLLVGSTS